MPGSNQRHKENCPGRDKPGPPRWGDPAQRMRVRINLILRILRSVPVPGHSGPRMPCRLGAAFGVSSYLPDHAELAAGGDPDRQHRDRRPLSEYPGVCPSPGTAGTECPVGWAPALRMPCGLGGANWPPEPSIVPAIRLPIIRLPRLLLPCSSGARRELVLTRMRPAVIRAVRRRNLVRS
jgi:hypothetical protein